MSLPQFLTYLLLRNWQYEVFGVPRVLTVNFVPFTSQDGAANTKGIRPSLTSLLLLGGDIKLTPGRAQKQERIENMYINQCQARKNRKHLMSVAHLNVRSVASRENFYLLKQTVTTKNFHIFIVSVSWLDRTVCNADILCFIKLYFGTVQLTIVSPTEWLQRL